MTIICINIIDVDYRGYIESRKYVCSVYIICTIDH